MQEMTQSKPDGSAIMFGAEGMLNSSKINLGRLACLVSATLANASGTHTPATKLSALAGGLNLLGLLLLAP